MQFKVAEAKEQLVAGTVYYVTIEIHRTACPEGSPSAEDKAACVATHTQKCVVYVLRRLGSDGEGHRILDPHPSCTAEHALPGQGKNAPNTLLFVPLTFRNLFTTFWASNC